MEEEVEAAWVVGMVSRRAVAAALSAAEQDAKTVAAVVVAAAAMAMAAMAMAMAAAGLWEVVERALVEAEEVRSRDIALLEALLRFPPTES